MPKPRKYPLVSCKYYTWGIINERGVWKGDGRNKSNGTGRRPTLGTGTRDEAIAVLHKFDALTAYEMGRISRDELHAGDKKSLLIAEAWERYLTSVESRVEAKQRQRKTPIRYGAIRDKHLKYCQEAARPFLHELTAESIDEYIRFLNRTRRESRGRDYAARTLYMEVTCLKQLAKFGKKRGWLPKDYELEYSMTKSTESDTYCYSDKDFTGILDQASKLPEPRWLYPVLMTAGLTGMRISELETLRWTDIDFAEKRIRIKDERHGRRATKGSARTTKGRKSRSVPIFRPLREVLKSLPRH